MTLYRLEGLRDIAFEIIKHHHFPKSRKPHKLKVAWWRVGRHMWSFGVTQNIELTDEQWGTRTPVQQTID